MSLSFLIYRNDESGYQIHALSHTKETPAWVYLWHHDLVISTVSTPLMTNLGWSIDQRCFLGDIENCSLLDMIDILTDSVLITNWEPLFAKSLAALSNRKIFQNNSSTWMISPSYFGVAVERRTEYVKSQGIAWWLTTYFEKQISKFFQRSGPLWIQMAWHS